MSTNNKKIISEMINQDLSFIKGDAPIYDNNDKSTTNKTTDSLSPMINGTQNQLNRYGIGYVLYEDEVTENIISKKDNVMNDILEKEGEITSLPTLYDISDVNNLSGKVKSVISTLKNSDNDIDKIAVLSEIIKHVDLSNVSRGVKKQILDLIKEKF